MREQTTDKSFQFIRSKINEIRSALFTYSDIDEVIYPTCIVSTLRVDDSGNVWFLMNRCRNQYLRADQRFAAQLSFYRKGFPFTLAVSGRADISADTNDMEDVVGLSADAPAMDEQEVVLVKMQILKATYSEWRGEKPASRIKRMYHRLMQWLDKSLVPFERRMEYQFQ